MSSRQWVQKQRNICSQRSQERSMNKILGEEFTSKPRFSVFSQTWVKQPRSKCQDVIESLDGPWLHNVYDFQPSIRENIAVMKGRNHIDLFFGKPRALLCLTCLFNVTILMRTFSAVLSRQEKSSGMEKFHRPSGREYGVGFMHRAALVAFKETRRHVAFDD